VAVKPRAAASTLAWMRMREVEVHHVDLNAGHTFAGTPDDLLGRLLDHSARLLSAGGALHCTLDATTSGRTIAVGAGGPAISGPDHALVAWLLRRGDGTGISVAGGGALPEPPSLG
jgi:maleylpyruvate isomerase